MGSGEGGLCVCVGGGNGRGGSVTGGGGGGGGLEGAVGKEVNGHTILSQ